MKPSNIIVADKAIARALGPEISYKQEDCQKFVEETVKLCGGSMDYRGSNAMARNMDWMSPITPELWTNGMLRPGTALFIHDPTEQPNGYSDGKGDFNHVGFYVGENAFEDVDKNGKLRMCNVVHSGETMGRVAGSKLEKRLVSGGWSHVGWLGEVDMDGIILPDSDFSVGDAQGEYPELPVITTPILREPGPGEAMVNTQEDELMLRKEPKVPPRGAPKNVIKGMPRGAIVKVLGFYGDWINVEFTDFRGTLHCGWCKTEYLRFG